jgi:hypothetical protein
VNSHQESLWVMPEEWQLHSSDRQGVPSWRRVVDFRYPDGRVVRRALRIWRDDFDDGLWAITTISSPREKAKTILGGFPSPAAAAVAFMLTQQDGYNPAYE